MKRSAVATLPHPSVEELIAYHEGRLGEAEEDRLQEHLASCASCVALVLDLDAFAAAGSEPADRPAEVEVAAFWKGLRQRLLWQRHRVPLAAAAAALLAAVGLSAWLVARQQATSEQAQLARVEPNLPFLELGPAAVERDEEQAGPRLEIPPGAASGVLVLQIPAAGAEKRYQGELATAAGGVVWSGPLLPDAFGTVVLRVPRELLPTGDYSLRVRAQAGGEEPILERRFRVEAR